MNVTLEIKKEADGVFSHLDSKGHFFIGNDIKVNCTEKQVKFTYNNPTKETSTYDVRNISLNLSGVITTFENSTDFIKKLKEEDYFIGTLIEVSNELENPLNVIPSMTSGGHLSVTTNATGTAYNTFASQECKQLNVSNQTGTTIEVQQGGTGVALQIPTGAFYTFFGITNTNQLGIRRVDTSNTQVTITARWEA